MASVSAVSSDATVVVTAPARAEFLHIVRTVVGAVAARCDLTIDAIEDVRIAVDEACSQLLVANGSTVTVRMHPIPDGLEVVCSTDAEADPWPPVGISQSLASQVLHGLTDEVAWERITTGPSIRIRKRGVGATAGR
jgi:serine/threonine-protein kinase RsbW